MMLVDLGRNDLGRVCEYGSVEVDELMEIESYSHVMHIVSSVSGTLREDVGAMDALRSVLPRGHAVGRAEGARDADHRRAGAHQARRLRRGDRLSQLHGRPGHRDPHPHGRRQGRRRARQAGGGTVADAKPAYEYEESSTRPRRSCAPSSWRANKPDWRVRHEGARDRQLRLVHLQPRPVPGRAGRGRAHRAQRRATVEELLRRLRALRDLAWAVHARRGRHLAGGGPADARSGRSHTGRVSRASVDGAGVRRARVKLHPPVHGKATTIEHDGRTIFTRTVLPADGRALPLAGGRRPAARLPGGVAHGGGVLMGVAPSRAAGRGRAVSPRVGADRAGQAAAGKLPGRRAESAPASSPERTTVAEDGLMPNPILTRAIDALASRRDLSAEETAEVLAQIMHGEASEIQIAGFLIALRTKGETVDELTGLAAHDARAGRARADRAHDLLDTAGTGGGAARSTCPRPPRWSRRGRVARWPSTATARPRARRGRRICWRRWARASTWRRGASRVHRGGRVRVHVRPRPPSGHALRDAGQTRAGGAHDLQFPRPAHQSGRRHAPADRRRPTRASWRRSPARSRGWGCSARWSSPARTGSTRSRPPRPPTWSRSTARSITRYTLDPADVGIELADPSDPLLAGGSPAENAEVTRAVLAGERGARADLVRDQRGRGDLRGRRGATSIAEGVEAARAALATAGAARAALERYVQASRQARSSCGRADDVWSEFAGRVMSCRAAQRAGAHPRGNARGVRAAQARRAAGELKRQAAAADDRVRRRQPGVRPRAALSTSACATGHRRDRRVQAALALGRHACARTPTSRRSWAPTSGAGRARCRCSPRAPTSRARSTICAPRARRARCRSCARTSSSTPTSCMRRCDAGADAVLLIVAALSSASWRRCTSMPRALGLDVLVEVHDREELASCGRASGRA